MEEGSAGGGWMFWQGNEKKTDGPAAQTLIPGFLRQEAVGERTRYACGRDGAGPFAHQYRWRCLPLVLFGVSFGNLARIIVWCQWIIMAYLSALL